ncbi:MAG TPA: S1/P1 nuclease [Bacteroidia bacterium]|nr:S1/P1 nuclease [Bacteroidia bacterium]
MKKTTLTLFAILILKASNIFAWGQVGHKMVAEIAMSYLNKGVKDSVQKYLGKMTFAEAGTWMDDVRSDKKYNYMKTWHYADVSRDCTYVEKGEANAINTIEKAMNELKDKNKITPEQINMDLKLLFHLIGDFHQPLHCGYPEDKGGNTVDVEFNFLSTNLHSTWDTKIIEYKLTDVQKGVLEFCKKLTPAEKKAYMKIDVVAWFNDARAYLPEAYNLEKGHTVQEEYMKKALPVIEKQLVIAGLRLAAVLNQAFAK